MNFQDFPAELTTSITNLEHAITAMEACVEKVIAVPLNETHKQLNPLEKAKYDMACVFAITSLYWAFMKTKGLDPTEHGLLKELGRVKEAMGRAKQIGDKPLAPRVNISASRRFIRGALWEAKGTDIEPGTSNISSSSLNESDYGPSAAKKLRTDSTAS